MDCVDYVLIIFIPSTNQYAFTTLKIDTKPILSTKFQGSEGEFNVKLPN